MKEKIMWVLLGTAMAMLGYLCYSVGELKAVEDRSAQSIVSWEGASAQVVNAQGKTLENVIGFLNRQIQATQKK